MNISNAAGVKRRRTSLLSDASLHKSESSSRDNSDASSPARSQQRSSESLSTPSRQSRKDIESSYPTISSLQKSPDNATSQLFSRPSNRRRSSLFESLPSRSRLRGDTSSSTILENDLQLDGLSASRIDDNSQLIATSPERQTNPSLFGAVMKKFGATVGTTTSSQLLATPKRKSANVDMEGENTQSLMSPSGKSIMTFVNRFVMNSPFRFQSPKSKRKDIDKQTSNENRSPIQTPSPRKRKRRLDIDDQDSRSSLDDNENWQEVSIRENQIEIVDWTLKNKIKLECNPGKDLNVAMGRHEFFESLRYWQYPISTDQAEQSDFGKKNKVKGQRLDKGKQEASQLGHDGDLTQSPSALATKLTQQVRGTGASLSYKRHDKFPNRQREWQEAFRSLYMAWCRKIEVVVHDEDFEESLSDFYFYSLGKDHMVLFCVDELDNAPYFQHRVVITNCSPFFQEKLESLGMRGMEFAEGEGAVTSDIPSPVSTENTKPMSPNVKADLEALRQAQAYGENAGADVHVKVQKKASHKAPTGNEKKIFSVSGFDHVSLFFEVYLNLLGQMTLNKGNRIESFPTLLCREIGPFLHASMKALRVFPIKCKEGTAVEIEGLLLPCAIRKVVGYLGTNFVQTTQDPNDSQNRHYTTTSRKDKDSVGQRYLVVHAATENQSTQSFKLNDSVSFNGWARRDDDFNGAYQCPSGKSIELIVWDSSRKNVVACNIK